jgi:hypothetical protein
MWSYTSSLPYPYGMLRDNYCPCSYLQCCWTQSTWLHCVLLILCVCLWC